MDPLVYKLDMIRSGKLKTWIVMTAGIVAISGGGFFILSQFFASSDLSAEVKVLEVKEELRDVIVG